MKRVFFGILFLAFLFSGTRSYPQQGINVTAGIGFPELINLGIRVQFDQTELGLSAGTFPESGEDVLSLSANYYYHFGGSSEFTDLRPWFLKAGLTYAYSENEWNRGEYFFLGPGIGREFNISSNFAVALETGFFVILSENEKEKRESPDSIWNFDFDFTGSVLPAAGINLIYRF